MDFNRFVTNLVSRFQKSVVEKEGRSPETVHAGRKAGTYASHIGFNGSLHSSVFAIKVITWTCFAAAVYTSNMCATINNYTSTLAFLWSGRLLLSGGYLSWNDATSYFDNRSNDGVAFFRPSAPSFVTGTIHRSYRTHARFCSNNKKIPSGERNYRVPVNRSNTNRA